jgi:UDPglucose--hexose-1-phosphate uridylyltransferase
MTDNQPALHEQLLAPGGVWEERWHPLREEWVIVAAHRQNRPWSGEMLEHQKGGNFLSDTAPEEKAAELRAQPDTHYTVNP